MYCRVNLNLLTLLLTEFIVNSVSNFNNVSIQGLYSLGYKKNVKRAAIPITHIPQSDMVSKILDGYVRTDPPILDSTTSVSIGIFVISFYSVNEQTMDYSVSMYLRQEWYDNRLAFAKHKPKYDRIRMGDGGWNKIWIPDTFLRNEKAASFHGVTVENRLLRIFKNGRIWYATKISATLSCPMTLEKFPMDTQVCPMAFESFGYTKDTMDFAPSKEVIAISANLQLPQFSLDSSTHSDCSQNYTTGSYPCLEIKFKLRRDIGYFLIQVYVPSVLIVILSWVSFWINVDASPARVSIGLLTVLTTTTMSSGARSTLPRVSYIKAIDVWMIVCLVFVFTSLIEYAVVNVLARKVAKPPRQTAQKNPPIPRRAGEPCPPPQPARRKRTELSCFKKNEISAGPPEPDGKRRARAVDKLSRKIFPFSFLLFNLIYWLYYYDFRQLYKNQSGNSTAN